MGNRVIVVTGGASGIGKAIVDEFHQLGDRVYSIDIHAERLKEQEIEGIVPLQVDITDGKEIKSFVKKIKEKEETIHALINGAGVMDAFTPLAEISDELWDKVLDVNATGLFKVTREFIPIFQKQRYGKIINIASIASKVGPAGGTAYVTSKHAVLGLTKNVAAFYAKDGIYSNAIGPGGIKSHLNESYGKVRHQKGFDIIANQYGNDFSYEGEPEDISKIAKFLVSDDSNFINGEIIYANQDYFIKD